MKIAYKDLSDQEIANLIAWYAQEKGCEIVIHTKEGDAILKFVKKKDVPDVLVIPAPFPLTDLSRKKEGWRGLAQIEPSHLRKGNQWK